MRVIQCLNACSIKIQLFDPFPSRLAFNRATRDFIESKLEVVAISFFSLSIEVLDADFTSFKSGFKLSKW